uniref:DUF7210 domain-containing protein n=1 Tax=viral metagenome TaxID=1070528 RepID=A0A6M3M590_9ZZZZ
MNYIALRKIGHNGKDYLPGDTILLTIDEAEPLLSSGAIRVAPEAPPKRPMINKTMAMKWAKKKGHREIGGDND